MEVVGIEIKIHKKLNRSPIKFEKESSVKLYKEIIRKINKSETLDDIYTFTLQELREKIGITNTKSMIELQKFFHNTKDLQNPKIGKEKGFHISGGVFLSMVDEKEGTLKFAINPFWKEYFYSRIDIDQWYKINRNQEGIKTLELGEGKKEKFLNVMTTVINHSVKGKYSQRLVDLLYQFKETGFFIMDWGEFKQVLEVNPNYRAREIDTRVLNPAKEELKKVGIKITKIDKVKKGRSIDKIKIFFKMESLKIQDSGVLEVEKVESSDGIDKAILKAKRNIYVSKTWNKRAENKINKLLKEHGEGFTINLLDELYINLKQDVKTTLVQYINGIVKNINLEQVEEQDKKNKKTKSVKVPVQEVKELKKEIKEPINSELTEYKEEVKKIGKEQLKKEDYFIFNSQLITSNTFEKVNKLVIDYSLNKTIPGTKEKALEKMTKKELKETYDKLYFSMDSNLADIKEREIISQTYRIGGRWRKEEYIKAIKLLKSEK